MPKKKREVDNKPTLAQARKMIKRLKKRMKETEAHERICREAEVEQLIRDGIVYLPPDHM